MAVGLAIVVRDEEDLIGEWLAYHAELGVERMLVYDNGSSDRTAAIVSAAAREVDVAFIAWPDQTCTFQTRAYEDALARFGAKLDWLGFLDADEFVATDGVRSLPETLRGLDAAPGVAVNWLVFGSNALLSRPRGLVTETFLRRSKPAFGPNCHVKCFVQPFTCTGMINCHQPAVRGALVDPKGRVAEWQSPGVSARVRGTDVLSINHYFVRSWEDWSKKLRRGYRDLTRAQSDFNIYDRNEELDMRAAVVAERAKQRFSFLGRI